MGVVSGGGLLSRGGGGVMRWLREPRDLHAFFTKLRLGVLDALMLRC